MKSDMSMTTARASRRQSGGQPFLLGTAGCSGRFFAVVVGVVIIAMYSSLKWMMSCDVAA